MDNKDKEKRTTIILTIIASITLLVMIAGATFAFYAVTITGGESASSVFFQTSSLGVIFVEGNTLNAENIEPGWSTTRTFTIQNKGNAAAVYNIVWRDVINDFAVKSELRYNLSGVVTSGTGSVITTLNYPQAPSTNENILTNITIDANTIHTYTLTLSFPDTLTNQDHNQGRTFMGRIVVTTGS